MCISRADTTEPKRLRDADQEIINDLESGYVVEAVDHLQIRGLS